MLHFLGEICAKKDKTPAAVRTLPILKRIGILAVVQLD
jgi:hypothetical protein